ncbi:unnamed protein product [Ceutorhynchus assimilis]|uniref:Uncharacterized protein n=1 Tax=Ceutorhynchus assimilis TaxID=467358 RepID=A0A9N9QK41_9CUCU|nr:unnamed protein product [Ceutorhynchus assimilis]
MRHRHRWPYILILPLWLFLPSLLANPAPTPLSRTRHQQQRQIQRLAGGHLKIVDSDADDSELITASAGENTKNQKGGKQEEERKTLSQQVADGKYGLIQNELFKKPPKRPGIISYAPNPEVPKDNIATLGGLTKNDIWLAENHLLVLKGGTYPTHDDKEDYLGQIWQPIDNYNAPLHQVKIPKNPAVPPPFPVQFTDDGPLQILGTNSTRTLNASAETPAYALPPPPGWDGEIPPQSQYFPETGATDQNPPDSAAGQVTMRVPNSGEPAGGLPFPPALLNGSLAPYFAHLPPGAAILPPPQHLNETNPDLLDEDDPSIFYPPPYSFYYPKDNSSVVPPGPLVPGIILPPPPKFFTQIEDKTTTTRKPLKTYYTTTESPLNNEISTQNPFKTKPTRVSVIKNYSVRVGMTRRPISRQQTTKLIKTTIPTTGKPKLITILPVHVDQLNRTYLPSIKRKPPVTILKPVKPEIATSKVYTYHNEVTNKPRRPIDSQRPQFVRQKPNNGFVSTTQVPLKYHHTTVDNNEISSITPAPEKFSIGINAQYPKTTPKPPANYYYYEETDPSLNSITTEAPLAQKNPNTYYNPYYIPPRKPSQQQYIYVTGRPYESEKPKFRYQPPRQQGTFSIHIAKLQNQIHQYYTTPRPTSKPVYQYSFEAQNYRRPGGKTFRPSPLMDDSEDSFRPIPQYSVEIQPAIQIIPTQQPSYQQVQPLNVDEPSYRPQQQYLQEIQSPRQQPVRYNIQESPVVVTPSRPIAEFSYNVTPNPINQGYYTKPDEGYFDENTKQYFTIFGRKLPSSTTPLPPRQNFRQQSIRNRPIVSLESDIKVNYARPRPHIDPQSEPIRQQYHQEEPTGGAEIIKAIEITPPSVNSGGKERYIHYRLPGDEGAHFYFLTPQVAERRRQGYFYERDARVRRDQPPQHTTEGKKGSVNN